jgi:hypothetical protein
MVRFKAKIRLFRKEADENKGRVNPALSGYSPQIILKNIYLGA